MNLKRLAKVPGLNLTDIAKKAKVKPHRLIFALRQYESRPLSQLSIEEEDKIVTTLIKIRDGINAAITE